MRVLLCIYRDSERAGGSVRVAEILIRSLMGKSIDLHVAVAYGSGGRIESLLRDRCHFLGAKNRSDLGGWARCRRLLDQLKPDIVHYVDPVGWMIVAGIGLTRNRVMHQHRRPGTGAEASKISTLNRLLFCTAPHVIAISYGAARELSRLYGVDPKKITVVHNAIDKSYLTLPASDRDGGKRLGMAVRVVEDKGVGEGLQLLSILPRDFILSVAGDGPHLDALKASAEDMGVSNRVEWLGSVTDIAAFYSSIDYYLFLSWYEGFGLSVAEAMSCGKPVVGFLGDGEISEAEYPLVTADNSVLIDRSQPKKFGPEENPEKFLELRDAITLLDSDKDRHRAVCDTAGLWIERNFSSEQYGIKIFAMYAAIASHKQS